MVRRGQLVGAVLLGVCLLVVLGVLSGGALQSTQDRVLDIQVVGMLRYTGYLWIAVHDASGPLTRLLKGNFRVEAMMYPVRSMDDSPDTDNPYAPVMEEFKNVGDGVYRISFLPKGGADRWDQDFDYIFKIYVTSPAGTGTALGTFHWGG